MKISISAIGRLRNSPEKEMVDDYLSRFSKLSKPFGISLNPVIEIEDKKGGGSMSEAKLLMKSFQRNSKIIALDERGIVLSKTILFGGSGFFGPVILAKDESIMSSEEKLSRYSIVLSKSPVLR